MQSSEVDERRSTTPLGVGVGLRRQHFEALSSCTRRVDWLEVIPEAFIGAGGRHARVLAACAERYRLVSHGVALSLGGPDPIDVDFVRALKAFNVRVGTPYFSEHICYSRLGGMFSLDLLPLPFTEEAIKHVASRAREVSERLELPIVLENITYYAEMPGSALSEAEFLRGVLEEADAGLLLDVNNLYVNALNHGTDARETLRALPLERTRQMHLAGHRRTSEVVLDDHGGPVADGVLDLYAFALELTGPVPVLIEWDNNVPELDRLLDEADRARGILERVTGVKV